MGRLIRRSWRRRVSPSAPTATVPEPSHGNAGSGTPSPFHLWSVVLLGDRALIVVTDDGIYERIGPRLWEGHNVGTTVANDPLAVAEFLESCAREYWRDVLQHP